MAKQLFHFPPLHSLLIAGGTIKGLLRKMVTENHFHRDVGPLFTVLKELNNFGGGETVGPLGSQVIRFGIYHRRGRVTPKGHPRRL